MVSWLANEKKLQWLLQPLGYSRNCPLKSSQFPFALSYQKVVPPGFDSLG